MYLPKHLQLVTVRLGEVKILSFPSHLKKKKIKNFLNEAARISLTKASQRKKAFGRGIFGQVRAYRIGSKANAPDYFSDAASLLLKIK